MLNFLGLDPKYSNLESAKYCIFPIPYERTTTFGKGTEFGPKSILEPSQQVELYDEELNSEPYLAGIATLQALTFPENLDINDCIDLIYSTVKDYLSDNKYLCSLGGEHSITFPIVKAHLEKYPNLQVLQIDAHADLRQEYEGSPYNHACVMARIHELTTFTSVGIRSLSIEESEFIRKNNLPVWFARQMAGNTHWMFEVLESIQNPVYITLDVDYFDISIMPATGTPEPGGGHWYPTLQFLKHMFSEKEVVGLDVVEYAPRENDHASGFMVAKFLYKMIAYWENGKREK